MNIAIHIPVWVLWAVGVPVVVLVLLLAVFGWLMLRSWSQSGGYV